MTSKIIHFQDYEPKSPIPLRQAISAEMVLVRRPDDHCWRAVVGPHGKRGYTVGTLILKWCD